MKPSIFFSNDVALHDSILDGNILFPISFMALEVYSTRASQAGKDDELLLSALSHAIKTCCGISNPSDRDVAYFVERLEAFYSEKNVESATPAVQDNPGFGTEFANYLSSLRVDQLLLKMCNYDYEKANFLYCEIDRDSVQEMLSEYMRGCHELNRVNMEASMYGFGGSYKPKSGGAMDLDSEEGVQSFKQLGF